MYNEPEGLARDKGRETVPHAGARRPAVTLGRPVNVGVMVILN